jgi:hypothetical protein
VAVVTAAGAVHAADAVVVTVPLGVLKAGALRFVPELPAWKQEAVRKLGFGDLNKVTRLGVSSLVLLRVLCRSRCRAANALAGASRPAFPARPPCAGSGQPATSQPVCSIKVPAGAPVTALAPPPPYPPHSALAGGAGVSHRLLGRLCGLLWCGGGAVGCGQPGGRLVAVLLRNVLN